jgi:hypothetical protein
MILASLAGLVLPLFHVEFKGGREIKTITPGFDRRDEERKA